MRVLQKRKEGRPMTKEGRLAERASLLQVDVYRQSKTRSTREKAFVRREVYQLDFKRDNQEVKAAQDS